MEIVNGGLCEDDRWITEDRSAEACCRAFELGGPAYTLFDGDGRVIACGGVYLVRKGVGEAWTLVSSRATGMALAIHKTTVRILGRIIETYDLERVQAVTKENHGRKWLKALGFHCETPEGMERYAGGATYFMYARVR